MTKQIDPAMSATDGAELRGEARLPKKRACFPDFTVKFDQGRDYLPAPNGGVLQEPDAKIGAEFYLVLEGTSFCSRVKGAEWNSDYVLAIACEPNHSFAGHAHASFWKNQIDGIRGYISRVGGEQKKAVFINYVESVELIDRICPARFWLTFIHRSGDIFTGELYKSSAQNIYFVVRSINGELDRSVTVGERADNSEIGEIKRCSHIVNSVTNDERNGGWDGLLALYGKREVVGGWIEPSNELKRLFGEKITDSPIRVVDVMRRAF